METLFQFPGNGLGLCGGMEMRSRPADPAGLVRGRDAFQGRDKAAGGFFEGLANGRDRQTVGNNNNVFFFVCQIGVLCYEYRALI